MRKFKVTGTFDRDKIAGHKPVNLSGAHRGRFLDRCQDGRDATLRAFVAELALAGMLKADYVSVRHFAHDDGRTPKTKRPPPPKHFPVQNPTEQVFAKLK